MAEDQTIEWLQLQRLKHLGRQLLIAVTPVASFKTKSESDVDMIVTQFVDELCGTSGLQTLSPAPPPLPPPPPLSSPPPRAMPDFVQEAVVRVSVSV